MSSPNWEEILKYHVLRHSDKVRRITKPLREHFDIEYFTYHHISNKGEYSVLLDSPKWAEHYVAEKYYLLDPYLCSPNIYQTGLSIVDEHGSEKYKKAIIQGGKAVLNLDFGFLWIERSASGVEFFGFSGKWCSKKLHRLYLNYSHLIKAFIAHFKKNLNNSLSHVQNEAGYLPTLKGKSFFQHGKISPSIDHLEFLLDLNYDSQVELARSLTRREKDCLDHLLKNHSAKQTAYLLNLSPRTVESYLNTIKNKFCCQNKYELFAIAKELNELMLI